VVAKGRSEVGRAILDAALTHGVPLERDPLLAEALSRVELDREIPRELYRATAIVIGFILKARSRRPTLPPGP
jgi:flagellar biosynthesis protein